MLGFRCSDFRFVFLGFGLVLKQNGIKMFWFFGFRDNYIYNFNLFGSVFGKIAFVRLISVFFVGMGSKTETEPFGISVFDFGSFLSVSVRRFESSVSKVDNVYIFKIRPYLNFKILSLSPRF